MAKSALRLIQISPSYHLVLGILDLSLNAGADAVARDPDIAALGKEDDAKAEQ